VTATFSGIMWGVLKNVKWYFMDVEWYDTRNTKLHLINPAVPEQAPAILTKFYGLISKFLKRKTPNSNRYKIGYRKTKLFLIVLVLQKKWTIPLTVKWI
jgi:hypothetical protein